MPIHWDNLEQVPEDDPIFSGPHFVFKQPQQTFTVLVGPLKPIDEFLAEKRAKEVEKDLPTKPTLPADG